MKVTFFSNFLNHHQLPLCMEMYARLGEQFKIVATERVPQERLGMGYLDMSTLYPFSLNTYGEEAEYQRALQLGFESDVVIIGSASVVFIQERLKSNKLTFHYSERIFKKGRHRALLPKSIAKLLIRHHRYMRKSAYMLCASAYTAADFNLVGLYRNKTFKWGYFPEVRKHNLPTLFACKNDNPVPKLLWAGRFIKWKHPEDAIVVAHRLKQMGIAFSLDMIGIGPLESTLLEMIDRYDLSKEVCLLGAMSPDEVRDHMERADVFLFTSDFNEGWGAVLNEAMNSACAVVASHAIGAVPFLLENNENGKIYRNGDIDHLYLCVKEVVESAELRRTLGENAYNTVSTMWNPIIATERILALSQSLIEGEPISYEEGPCSKASNISQNFSY